MRYRIAWYVGLVALAALVANLLVKDLGVTWTPVIAFGLIGCDIVARDGLHLSLSGRARWLAIGAAIALGSLATYIVNQGAGAIALASVTAFAAGLTVDTIAFSAAHGLDRQRRVTVSNFAAAAVDTIVFFAIAFGLGAVAFPLVFAQFAAKLGGGAFFALFLVPSDDVAELYDPEGDEDALLSRNA